jgi:S1-C subfamily serine protease
VLLRLGLGRGSSTAEPVRTRPVIAEVVAETQAARLGLKASDVLVSYGGKDVALWSRFQAEKTAETAEDKPRDLKILREGKPLTFMVAAGLLGVMGKDQVVPEATAPKPGMP